MPRLWSTTIQQHHHDVREAILDKTAALARAHGLHATTMSQIAKDVGIGRATLYKYFDRVEEIIVAWHEREMMAHLSYLMSALEGKPAGMERVSTLIGAHAHALHHHHDPTVILIDSHLPDSARGELAEVQDRIRYLLMTVLAEAAARGEVRSDAMPDELARFVLHSLGAAADLPSRAAVERLITMVVGALLPPVTPRPT